MTNSLVAAMAMALSIVSLESAGPADMPLVRGAMAASPIVPPAIKTFRFSGIPNQNTSDLVYIMPQSTMDPGNVPVGTKLFKNRDMDMLRSIKVYAEVGYRWMIMPDHVPRISGRDPAMTAFAFTYGYIAALLQAAEEAYPGSTS